MLLFIRLNVISSPFQSLFGLSVVVVRLLGSSFSFLFGFVRLAKMKMCYQMCWADLSFCFTTNIFSKFPFYQFSSVLSNNAFSVVLSGKIVLYLEAKICLFSSGNVISTKFWFLFLHKIIPIVGFSFSCFT